MLAGGAARRYGGQPKGLLQLGGRRILDRVVDAVAV
ncbi:MAG: NTP transferase domain-containing protein, partial [Acidimicrobiales bacterium]